MERRTGSDRLLSAFASVRNGEGPTALLLMANLFVLMTAYYIIKPVRDSLILADVSPEIKSYAGAAGVLVFLLIVPVYGRLASRLNRVRLINSMSVFFAANLVVFCLLAQFGMRIGILFFVWAGVFSLLLVAQFWAFANDLYTQEQGGRLFAVIGIGSSLGAIFGAASAARLFVWIGAQPMMLVAAVLLALSIVLTNSIHRRDGNGVRACPSDNALKPVGGFQLVLGRRYLFLIALVILLSNTVTTTGEFILGKSVSEHVTDANHIGVFYADYYFQVNLLGAVLQIFAVSRITRRIGIGPALFVLPILSFGGYMVLSYIPLLSFARAIKIVENGAAHSIQNTVRHALFLCTSREAKYKGKTAIDSFFWRAGDALSALIVFAGTHLAFDVRGFARTNAVMTAAWLCVVAAIVWMRLTRDESHVDQTHPLVNESARA